MHELVHSTGHAKRLNREGITSSSRQFGDPVYAFEELIAEMGSAFLCAQLGVFGEVQHDSYVDHWLKVLKSDKRPCSAPAGMPGKRRNICWHCLKVRLWRRN